METAGSPPQEEAMILSFRSAVLELLQTLNFLDTFQTLLAADTGTDSGGGMDPNGHR